MNDTNYDHDDVNDILSMVMGNATRPLHTSNSRASSRNQIQQPQFTPQISEETYVPMPSGQNDQDMAVIAPKQRSLGWFYVVTTLIFLMAFSAAGFFGRPYLSALLAPPSPFKDKVAQTSFPLVYPTKLPGAYKIELDSIARQENNMISYSISNDRAQRVLITLQEVPKGLNLLAFEEQYTDFMMISTKQTTVKVGTTADNTNSVHMIVGKTWLTFTSSKDTFSKADYNLLLNNLEIATPN